MSSSVVHDDVKKLVGLLVDAVHLVKSPANKKRFFIIKGEAKVDEKELMEKLKKDSLSEDEIAFIMSNEHIKNILLNDSNEKKALDVIKDSIKRELIELENALESTSISDLTAKMVKPFEGITNLLSSNEDDKQDDAKDDNSKNDKHDNENDDTKDNEKEIDDDNSVSELAEEISGLASDVSELATSIVD